MGRFAQGFMGVLIMILALLAMFGIIPDVAEAFIYSTWIVGMVLMAMSWR